jgi:hypothetical protein
MDNVFNRLMLPQPTSGALSNFGAVPTSVGGLFTGGFGTFGNLPIATGIAGPASARSGLFVARFQF